MFGPERICVSGMLASAGDLFLEPLRTVLRARPLLPDPEVFVVQGECDDAEVRGALAIASDTADSLKVRDV